MGTLKEKDNYVLFSLGTELFGISVDKALEVLENDNISKAPDAPPHVIGVVNFRGDIVPVFDLNSRFKIPPKEGLPGVIIVIDLFADNEKVMLGIKVDKVLGVKEIFTKDIKNSPEVGVSFNPKFIDGIVQQDEGLVYLIEPDLLVSHTDLTELDFQQDK